MGWPELPTKVPAFGPHGVKEAAGDIELASAAKAIEEGVVGDEIGLAATVGYLTKEVEGLNRHGVQAEIADEGIEGTGIGVNCEGGAEHFVR